MSSEDIRDERDSKMRETDGESRDDRQASSKNEGEGAEHLFDWREISEPIHPCKQPTRGMANKEMLRFHGDTKCRGIFIHQEDDEDDDTLE